MGDMRMGFCHVKVMDLAEAREHYVNVMGLYPTLLTSIVDMVHSLSCIEIRYIADRGHGHEQHATHRPAGLRPR